MYEYLINVGFIKKCKYFHSYTNLSENMYEISLITKSEAVLKSCNELRYGPIMFSFLLWYMTNAE